jgi:flavin reductase (DIM6/NTAB) family NADH-FMN oxidoreductase RutF
MKKEFDQRPERYVENWDGEFNAFSWQDFLTAIPSPLFLVTSYKENGKENACLQSWSTFVGDGGEFICLIGSVSKRGHLYQTLLKNGCCVLNFPDANLYDKCLLTIKNNGYEDDEISLSGLTSEKAMTVNAPRVKECFLNIECEVLWIKEHFENSRDVTVALKGKHVAMDNDHYDERKCGRYGKSGYLYNIHDPQNPENGEVLESCLAVIERLK